MHTHLEVVMQTPICTNNKITTIKGSEPSQPNQLIYPSYDQLLSKKAIKLSNNGCRTRGAMFRRVYLWETKVW